MVQSECYALLLAPSCPQSSGSPDLFVLGFQEIVPLTAQQIIQTDPEKMYVAEVLGQSRPFDFSVIRRMWETVIMDTLSRRHNKQADYVILRSEQVRCYLCLM